MKKLIYILISTMTLTSCVSSRKFNRINKELLTIRNSYTVTTKSYEDCQNNMRKLSKENQEQKNKIDDLTKQNEYLKANGDKTLQQLEELSVLSQFQAETIKESIRNIGNKDFYIQSLQQKLDYKDSLNFVLVMNLKGALENVDDKDIEIKIDKGVVYIDISDNLLFNSGKYNVTEEAKVVLGKVAQVLKNKPDIEFMVEGHTDNVSYSNGLLIDNWDLSVKRATSVVRILQYQYGLNPSNMIAAGRGEYSPTLTNSNEANRKFNRKTRIKILPKLDQFFQLFEKTETKATRE